jgi:hypothetical protein
LLQILSRWGGKKMRFNFTLSWTSSVSWLLFLFDIHTLYMGLDSSVGIATRYGLGSPGIETRCSGEIFRTRPDRPLWAHPSSNTMGNGSFPGGKAAGAWRSPPTSI